MAIAIRKPREIEKLRKANQIVAETLQLLQQEIKVGISTLELDKIAEEYILSRGAKPSFKGLYGFPNTLCTSVNGVIIHGIPSDYKLQSGDIVGLDVGTRLDGYFGDSAITVGVGDVSEADQKLMKVSEDTLYFAIKIIKAGMRFKELSQEIEKFIISKNCVPLRGFCGHGIGTKPHEDPQIMNYLDGKANSGPKIKNGMVFCLEPMICQTNGKPVIDGEDKWSVYSEDGLKGTHHEHTVVIINGKAEILSKI